MKVTERTYTVEITNDEVNTVVKALELYYKHTAKAPDVKVIRNAFANLLNIRYTGEDA